jgi:broad specificity phosphatase PhoE
MELLLIRHGQPHSVGEGNGNGADPGLTPEGVQQALMLSAFLAVREAGEISVVYSSTQRRAVQTARYIADRLRVPLHLDDALLEFDHGATFYTPVEDLKLGPAERWQGVEEGRWGNHVFDLPRFRARVHDAIEGIVERHPATSVAVVCHGGVINSYLGEVLGAPRLMLFSPAYTSVTRIAAARSGHRQMRAVNETVHLDPLVAAEIIRHLPAPSHRLSTPDPFSRDCAVATEIARDEQLLTVLHILRLGGFVPPQTISERGGLDVPAVEAVLTAASEKGLVKERSGRISGWCLTADGRTTHLELLAREVEASGAQPAVELLYERFLELNEPFKQTCARWQMRTGLDGEPQPNDHGDAEYDNAVIRELGSLHERTLSLARDLAGELGRFARYEREFDAAWRRLSGGDRRAFAAPMSASYHDLWMELHQDLMCTLGRARTAADGH